MVATTSKTQNATLPRFMNSQRAQPPPCQHAVMHHITVTISSILPPLPDVLTVWLPDARRLTVVL